MYIDILEKTKKCRKVLRISEKSCTFAANFDYDIFRNDFFRNSNVYGKSF